MVFGSPVLALLAIPFLLAIVTVTIVGTIIARARFGVHWLLLPLVSLSILVLSFLVSLAMLQAIVTAIDNSGKPSYTDVPIELVDIAECRKEFGEINLVGNQQDVVIFTVTINTEEAQQATNGKLDEAHKVLVIVRHWFSTNEIQESFKSTGSVPLEPGNLPADKIVVNNEQLMSWPSSEDFRMDDTPECEIARAFIVH